MAMSEAASQSMADRGENRSRQPQSSAFRDFIGSGWGPRPSELPERERVADFLRDRTLKAGAPFPGERLVVPAGPYKVRSNDCDYRFRAHSAFAHLSGLGGEKEPDTVLVLEPNEDGTHTPLLFFKPRASRSSKEFYADARYGEFWVGARPSLEELSAQTGLETRHIDTLRDVLAKDAGTVQLRIVRGVDANVEAMVNEVRTQAGLPAGEEAREDDERFEERLSEIRLTKDAFELDEMIRAVEVTKAGFEDIIRVLPRAVGHRRGERVIEGAFRAVAREEGNGEGYETIAASGNHANTLHWIDNDGEVREGDLVLVDAGVEVDSLYTADITRTLPVNGRFTEVQARVYQAVLDACEAALARAGEPGCRFKDVHDAAMKVIAARLHEWGILPVTPEESLSPEGQQHRRWMPHGTSHHLGLDVHDCAKARAELYQGAAGAGHGLHDRAGPVLPRRRPADPRGIPGHRRAHRRRRRRERRRHRHAHLRGHPAHDRGCRGVDRARSVPLRAAKTLRLRLGLVLFGGRGRGVLVSGRRTFGADCCRGRGLGRAHGSVGLDGRGLGRLATTGHLPVLGRCTEAGATIGEETDGILLGAHLLRTRAHDARAVAGSALQDLIGAVNVGRGQDRVALRDNLLRGHEVAAASANDEGQGGQSHTDQGANDDAADDPRTRSARALSGGHEHATQGSPQAAAGGAREGRASDRQASFDAFDEVQVGADNRNRGNIEASIRQEVDTGTGLRVGLVRGDLGACGHLRVHHDSHFFSFVPGLGGMERIVHAATGSSVRICGHQPKMEE